MIKNKEFAYELEKEKEPMHRQMQELFAVVKYIPQHSDIISRQSFFFNHEREADVNNLRLTSMDEIELKPVEWLLYPYIPYGKVTIIQGDPGEGKTTVILQIIACLTKGRPIAGEGEPTEPINVIYQTAEDGLGDTIKPRLIAADADCSKVLVIDDSDKPLSMDDERLEMALDETKARLLVLDPIQGYLGAGVDMHRANEIRPLMKRLANLAERYQCAVILIGHMNKNGGEKAGYRGLGSIDFQAAARSVMVVGRIKDDPELRVLCQTKNSLAPEGTAIAFRLDKESGFQWVGAYDITADDLLSGNGKGKKLEKSIDFLKSHLKDGGCPQKHIMEAAKEKGITEKTLRKAKNEIGVMTIKCADHWEWMLPHNE